MRISYKWISGLLWGLTIGELHVVCIQIQNQSCRELGVFGWQLLLKAEACEGSSRAGRVGTFVPSEEGGFCQTLCRYNCCRHEAIPLITDGQLKFEIFSLLSENVYPSIETVVQSVSLLKATGTLFMGLRLDLTRHQYNGINSASLIQTIIITIKEKGREHLHSIF